MRKVKIVGYQHVPNRNNEWFVFLFSYISAAKILAEKSKEPSGILKSNILLLPCLYSLRHGIELLLKYFAYALNDAPNHSHNIEELFDKAKDFARKAQIELTQHLRVKITAKGTGLTKKDFLVSTLTNLEPLVRKYSELSFLSGGLEAVEDKKNELFRYPISTEGNCLVNGLDTLLTKEEMADELLADLDLLIRYITIIGVMFGTISDGSYLAEFVSAESETKSSVTARKASSARA